jgi:tetratricopeptide (TPR) repeat protein
MKCIMTGDFLLVLARNLSSGLAGSLLLAIIILPFPVLAHIGISEEIEEVTGQIDDDSDAAELYLRRGDLHRLHGHWSEAITDFRTARQLDPGIAAPADLGMGRTYLDQGRYKESLKHLDRALAKQPNNVRGLDARARTFTQLGKSLAAAADYQRAIDSFHAPKKPLPGYYFERARALEAAGVEYFGTALHTLDAGISMLGDLRVLEDYAIELERKRGNYDAALQRLDRVIIRSARKETLLIKRGEILLQAGRTLEANDDFTAARDAILALPQYRRHSRAVKQMQVDINRHTHSPDHPSGRN